MVDKILFNIYADLCHQFILVIITNIKQNKHQTMSKRACTTSNNTSNKKQCTFIPQNAFKQVLAFCAPPHTLHKQMWSRIQPVNDFINGDPHHDTLCPGFENPVHRYVRDAQTGRTGKKIITETSWAFTNYRNCYECEQAVLDTDKQYDYDLDEFEPEPGHNVPCEIGGFGMIKCKNCVRLCAVCEDEESIGRFEDEEWYCVEHMPDDTIWCQGNCNTWLPRAKLNRVGTSVVCTPCFMQTPFDFLR